MAAIEVALGGWIAAGSVVRSDGTAAYVKVAVTAAPSDSALLVRTVRCRTVAKTLSIGFDVREVIAGLVDLAVDNLPSSLGDVRDGRLRALAVTTERRSPSLPDVPTTREASFPTVDAVAWFGIQAPAHTPRPVIDRLATEICAAVHDHAVQAKIEEQGVTRCRRFS